MGHISSNQATVTLSMSGPLRNIIEKAVLKVQSHGEVRSSYHSMDTNPDDGCVDLDNDVFYDSNYHR